MVELLKPREHAGCVFGHFPVWGVAFSKKKPKGIPLKVIK